MTEKQRQEAIKNGTLAEYYQQQVAEENASSNWKTGRIKLLNKEKDELLDEKYDLLLKVNKIDIAVRDINSKIEELKK